MSAVLALLDSGFDPDYVDALPPARRLAELRDRLKADYQNHQDRMNIHAAFELDDAADLLPSHELAQLARRGDQP